LKTGQFEFQCLSPIEDTHFHGFFNRLPTAADSELPIDVVQVSFYGFRRNEQFSSNFLVAQSLRQQIQYIELAIAQRVDQGLVGRGSGEDRKVELGMRPPARRGYRGLRPGGSVEIEGIWGEGETGIN